MLADGLTKVLTNTSFQAFREQLGLVDVGQQLQRKREYEDITEVIERHFLNVEYLCDTSRKRPPRQEERLTGMADLEAPRVISVKAGMASTGGVCRTDEAGGLSYDLK
ncbi:hypothetical protein CDV36_016356 [Fusarium kuroshium]|uniref:Uncharacterized protein n=2 Tax=Fusarium solani species complex TaxID=232080 RepID=A0A3M2QSU9_9HYPO|nr:hypothetical protein CDV36_016356 [Fusarium kuroshium]